MFNSISWQEFFLLIGLSALAYYSLTILLLFRTEVFSLFRDRFSRSPPVNQVPDVPDSEPGMMGNVQKGEPVSLRTSLDSARDIEVFPSNEGPESFSEVEQMPSAQDPSLLIGSVADLLQEIKTLVELIAQYKSPKEEATSLFQTLLLRYPHLRDSIYLEPVNFYICETAKSRFHFELNLDEIRQCWGTRHDTISKASIQE